MNVPTSITITPIRVGDLLAEHERMPIYVHVIDHPDARVLVDTGMTELHPAVADLDPRIQPLSTQDVDLAAIDIVVNTHLHFDHCGGNQHLTAATTYVHVDEVREARSPEPFEMLGYADRSWDGPDVTFHLLSGDVQLARGVHLFHTPGHTIGHYSLLVEVEGRRPMLFMSDVSYTPAAFAKEQQAGFHWNPVAGVRSIRRVKEIAREWDAEIFFTHDMDTFNTYKRAPDFYAG